MKNIRRTQLARHLHSAVNETHACRTENAAGPLCESRRGNDGEFSSRDHQTPGIQLRSDRSFTQSLWGRR